MAVVEKRPQSAAISTASAVGRLLSHVVSLQLYSSSRLSLTQTHPQPSPSWRIFDPYLSHPHSRAPPAQSSRPMLPSSARRTLAMDAESSPFIRAGIRPRGSSQQRSPVCARRDARAKVTLHDRPPTCFHPVFSTSPTTVAIPASPVSSRAPSRVQLGGSSRTGKRTVGWHPLPTVLRAALLIK